MVWGGQCGDLGEMKIKIGVIFLVCWGFTQSVFGLSYLLPKELIVSTNAFLIQNDKIGVNVTPTNMLFEVHNYPNTQTLLTIKSTGNVGINVTNPLQKLDVSGNIKLGNEGGLRYLSSSSGVNASANWKLIYRDDCNTYTSGNVSTGWKDRNGNAYTTVTTFNGYNILGGYQNSSTIFLGVNGGVTYYLYKDYTLPTHTRVKVIVEYYALDSWDSGEYGYVRCTDGSATQNSSDTCMLTWIEDFLFSGYGGPNYSYGGGVTYRDVVAMGRVQGYHTSNTLRVYVGSTLSSQVGDESFGIGSVEIWVR